MTVTVDDTNLKAIADAIREKSGAEDTYKPSEMAAAIQAIETGGDVDALIERTATDITSNATIIGDNTFSYYRTLITADFPLATTVDKNGFYCCSGLETLNLPKVKSIGYNSCNGCSALETVYLPECEMIDYSGFSGCKALEKIDLPCVTEMGSYAFRYGYSLKAVIMRKAALCSVGSSPFIDCYHILGTVNETYNPNGAKDGYIYVPSAVIEEYKTTVPWSSYADQFRALEDYTVDGTTTGALDESKI